jgi:hypothetical protein
MLRLLWRRQLLLRRSLLLHHLLLHRHQLLLLVQASNEAHASIRQ